MSPAEITVIIGGLSLSTGLMGTLIMAIWRSAGALAAMRIGVTNLEKTTTELEDTIKEIKKIAILELRIGNLEAAVAGVTTEQRFISGQQATVMQKMGLHSGVLRGITRGSKPEINPDDE